MNAPYLLSQLDSKRKPLFGRQFGTARCHAGHAGARPEGETHFSVTIVSAAFIGQSRVARQRLVYQTLADELATRVHALSLTTLAPDEDVRSTAMPPLR